MTPKKLNKKKITDFFIELHKRCQQEDTYSVKEAAQEMGVDYAQLQAWASSSEHWHNIYQSCRTWCAHNSDTAGCNGVIPFEDFIKYTLECNDEVIACYPTPEDQAKLLHYIRTTDEKDYVFSGFKSQL